jgi:predicted alpha-1,2-mannosidase
LVARMKSSHLRFVAVAAILLSHRCAYGDSPELADYVNTLQGTNSRFELTHGNTFPAVALPFGMHMWTPQTGKNGDGWKYQYFKDTIRGFQQSHQCSSWTNDYAVFSLMPTVGRPVVDEDERAAHFRHEDEVARPHYYRVALDNGTVAEMSPTERGAVLRFTFPRDKDGYVVLDGYTGTSGVKLSPADGRITGFVRNGGSVPPNFRNYFIIQFDRPIVGYGNWQHGSNSVAEGSREAEGNGVGAYVRFEPGTVVQLKVASSYISPEQAELNLHRELDSFDTLDDAAAAAKQIWNSHLARITVEGDREADKATFYSCFYRASLFPHQFFDYDKAGEPCYFSPYDGKVHTGYMFTDTGLWDTFRAQFPLHTILYPTMHGRYMQALLDAYEQCGWLPSWSFPGENGAMIGNHAISLLADAWVKGIRTFDPAQALEAYRHETTAKGPWGPANGRDGWQEYDELGYVPYPKHREATAKTLDYAYDDFCGYQLAKMSGDTSYAEQLAGRMLNYRNVYDASTGFMRGRNANGQWTPDFDPTEWGGPFTEGCAWHWSWSVPHDVAGLIKLMGGEKCFVEKLDSVFAQPSTYRVGTYGAPIHEMREVVQADMGQLAPGNQPMQHVLYLYDYAGQPWKTQQRVRDVMDRLYDASENGYPGDEDQGQTSSWFVLSALGFYSVCPGTDEYVLGSPLFEKATITLENGRKFVIEANGNTKQNVYIQSARLNGQDLQRTYLRHAEIVDGGRLELEMASQPNLIRGVKPADRPFSVSARDKAKDDANPQKAKNSAANFDRWGQETLAVIERDFRFDNPVIYCEEADEAADGSDIEPRPAFMWSAGVQLAALAAAARADSNKYRRPLTDYAEALQFYWQREHNGIGGYDVRPLPKAPDRFYDDNAWIVLGELETYEATHNATYLARAEAAFRFVLSGEDTKLGGGLYWRENLRDSKNTCANAPAVVAALVLYQQTRQQHYLDAAQRIYAWTCSNLQDAADGLFWDNIRLDGRVDKQKYTYNSALMIRANCLFYAVKRDPRYLVEAERIARSAAARWIDPKTGAIKDAGRFAHMLLESLLVLDQTTAGAQWQSSVLDCLVFVHQNVRDSNGHYPGRWDEPQTTALENFQLIDQASAARAFFAEANFLRQRNSPAKQINAATKATMSCRDQPGLGTTGRPQGAAPPPARTAR